MPGRQCQAILGKTKNLFYFHVSFIRLICYTVMQLWGLSGAFGADTRGTPQKTITFT